MAHQTSHLTQHTLVQWLAAHGYVTCDKAIAAAEEAVRNKEPEVALLFCRVAQALLEEREAKVRQGLPRRRFIDSHRPARQLRKTRS